MANFRRLLVKIGPCALLFFFGVQYAASLDSEERLLKELTEAKERISSMERKISLMESRTPSRYPSDTVLNYESKNLISGLYVGRTFLNDTASSDWENSSDITAGGQQYASSLDSDDRLLKELAEAKERISAMERKIAQIESRSPKRFPSVSLLSHKLKKRILVTGGAGFVGSHLVDKLMMAGHEVTVVDNFFTGSKRNVEQWSGHENFELIHQDIVTPLFVEVDEIYHLASPASPPHYMYNPVKTIKTNTIGTINMLGLAKRVGARILIASTSEVYGDPEVHPQPETYWGHVNPIGPRACYDEGKRVSETLSYAYAKQDRVSVRVARIFNTYGPRMHIDDGRVVSNFILQALKNETITIYGRGNQTRSFQYVSDLVDGLVSLMASNFTQPVNLGNPVEYTISEFASIIRAIVGNKNPIKSVDGMEDDPQRRKPDITRAKKYLKWVPKIPLREGLIRTIAYFRGELEKSKLSLSVIN